MKILVTGRGGKSGSWEIRGRQLGTAIGASVVERASLREMQAADIIVVVKRATEDIVERVRASGRPWVYDMVDGWPQPAGNDWDELDALSWLQGTMSSLKPTAVVFPTTQMQRDSGFCGKSIVLPHHAWPKYSKLPVKQKVSRIGYEGGEHYLGKWHKMVDAECRRRGWEFVVNGDMSSCQIGVALRDVNGYPAGAWKANTKLANLQALGIPAVISDESSYSEFGSSAQIVVKTKDDLSCAFDALESFGSRERIGVVAQKAAPRLHDVAKAYREWLCEVASS